MKNTFVKSCPKCEGEMRKDCNPDETLWIWYCIECGWHEFFDPCGGRKCDECEIGGCDHGIESELNPELRARMEQNSKVS
jgi:hypothetical protein